MRFFKHSTWRDCKPKSSDPLYEDARFTLKPSSNSKCGKYSSFTRLKKNLATTCFPAVEMRELKIIRF